MLRPLPSSARPSCLARGRGNAPDRPFDRFHDDACARERWKPCRKDRRDVGVAFHVPTKSIRSTYRRFRKAGPKSKKRPHGGSWPRTTPVIAWLGEGGVAGVLAARAGLAPEPFRQDRAAGIKFLERSGAGANLCTRPLMVKSRRIHVKEHKTWQSAKLTIERKRPEFKGRRSELTCPLRENSTVTQFR